MFTKRDYKEQVNLMVCWLVTELVLREQRALGFCRCPSPCHDLGSNWPSYILNERCVNMTPWQYPTLADPGGARDVCPPRGPNSLIFMQFSANNLQNSRLAHPLWELAPPQENLGSATAASSILTRGDLFLLIFMLSLKYKHCQLLFNYGQLD